MSQICEACIDGNVEAVQKFLEKNSANEYEGEKDFPVESTRSLLYLAASYGRAAVVDLLLKAGANVNKGYHYERVWADMITQTPLHAAVEANCNPAVVDLLVKAGAALGFGYWTEDTVTCTGTEETTLFRAAVVGNPNVIEILLKAGAQMSTEEWRECMEDKTTQLHQNVIDLLLQYKPQK